MEGFPGTRPGGSLADDRSRKFSSSNATSASSSPVVRGRDRVEVNRFEMETRLWRWVGRHPDIICPLVPGQRGGPFQRLTLRLFAAFAMGSQCAIAFQRSIPRFHKRKATVPAARPQRVHTSPGLRMAAAAKCCKNRRKTGPGTHARTMELVLLVQIICDLLRT